MRPELVWGDLILLPYRGRRWGFLLWEVLRTNHKFVYIVPRDSKKSQSDHIRIKHAAIPEDLILYDSPDFYEASDEFVGDWFGLYSFGSQCPIYVCRSKRVLAYARDILYRGQYVIRPWKPNA